MSNKIYILIQQTGKQYTGYNDIEAIENLNPEFSNGQEILVYDELTGKQYTIDATDYEDLLRNKAFYEKSLEKK